MNGDSQRKVTLLELRIPGASEEWLVCLGVEGWLAAVPGAGRRSAPAQPQLSGGDNTQASGSAPQ